MPSPLRPSKVYEGIFYRLLLRRDLTSSSHDGVRSSGLVGPAVRNLLDQYKLSPEKIAGSGPRGFVLKGDVLSFIRDQKLKPVIATAPLPIKATLPEKSSQIGKLGPKDSRGRVKYIDVPVSNNAKNSAVADVKGKINIPHSYLYGKASVDEALKIFSTKKGLEKVTLTEIVIKAAVAAAQQSPALSGKPGMKFDLGVQAYREKQLQYYVLRKVNSSGVRDIAEELSKKTTLESSALQNVPFKIVSLVGSQLDQITEILTPSQIWVLSIGDALVRIDAQTKATSKVVTLALTYNSTVISEADAGNFLANVTQSIERPVRILLGAGIRRQNTDNDIDA